MRSIKYGGGWRAIFYSLGQARRAGGLWRMYRALRSKNTCKTCALGMGGQLGGMVSESGQFPSVCKKSVQAMAADMQGRIRTDFFETFDFDRLAGLSSRELEASGRLVEPLYAGPDDRRYRPISWDEAFDRVIAKLKATPPEESFFYFSGRSSNEAGFVLQLLARLYGTNNVNSCSYYCHQASGVGLNSVIGSGTATVVLDDVHRCDLLFLIGANPASNHPRLMHTLVKLRRRGGKVVVINPLKETGLVRFKVPSDVRSLLFGSRIADEYLQPHIGGDIALLSGLAKAVHEAGAADRKFIADHTDGWKRFERQLKKLSWEEVVAASGVDRQTIQRVADLYAGAKKVIFTWAMGITHHEHGVQNVQAITNLALLRGMVGQPHAGLLPLRGHSNVQGIGSVGVTPRLKEAVIERLQNHFGVTLPETPGLDTLRCIERA
ncbi:MAG: molybdopterin-dependent oxidoreductase, partial [Planctomycetes bacterium]|nr:molybdopterin-dependent oxidoreductase [Planctomycetota bacterium]